MEDPIVIVDYDANWSSQYEQEKSQILDVLGDSIADIQHIGSTSVPCLAAKPIIDILLGLKQIPPSPKQVLSLENLGYLYLGEFGIPEALASPERILSCSCRRISSSLFEINLLN